MIEIIRSKKSLSFHPIVLSLIRVAIRSLNTEEVKTTCFEFLIFFVSFFRRFLEVPVLAFLEFNIPFERFGALSGGTQI